MSRHLVEPADKTFQSGEESKSANVDAAEESQLDDTADATAGGANYEFAVERVVDHQVDPVENRTYYLVKWEGYPDHQNTWELESNIQDLHCLQEYKQTMKPIQVPEISSTTVTGKLQAPSIDAGMTDASLIASVDAIRDEDNDMDKVYDELRLPSPSPVASRKQKDIPLRPASRIGDSKVIDLEASHVTRIGGSIPEETSQEVACLIGLSSDQVAALTMELNQTNDHPILAVQLNPDWIARHGQNAADEILDTIAEFAMPERHRRDSTAGHRFLFHFDKSSHISECRLLIWYNYPEAFGHSFMTIAIDAIKFPRIPMGICAIIHKMAAREDDVQPFDFFYF